MIYNNGFPVGYPYYVQNPAMSTQATMNQWQPQTANTQQNATIASQSPTNTIGVLWVQGEAGARSFDLKPGTMAILMDSENDRFYVKSVDSSGMPLPLRAFKYFEDELEQDQESSNVDLSGYVTKEELSALISSEIQKAFASIGEKPEETKAAAKNTSKTSTRKVK